MHKQKAPESVRTSGIALQRFWPLGSYNRQVESWFHPLRTFIPLVKDDACSSGQFYAGMNAYCGRVIQSSGPLRYTIVDGMNVRDSRVHNYPPRWNAASGQELLVIRRNHQTGEISRPIALAPARL